MEDVEKKRPSSLSGVYLGDAVDALRNSGSSDALYDDALRRMDPEKREPNLLAATRHEARDRRIGFSRTALLFAAFAAESYINEFGAWHFKGADLKTLDRLPTVEKFVLLPRLALGRALFARDSGPLQRVAELFKLRDLLVHPKPGKGLPERDARQAMSPDPVFNPATAAKMIVAVADAAGMLLDYMGTDNVDDWTVRSVIYARNRFLEFGQLASHSLPAVDAPPVPPYPLISFVKETSEAPT